jgi:hypothetical protein
MDSIEAHCANDVDQQHRRRAGDTKDDEQLRTRGDMSRLRGVSVYHVESLPRRCCWLLWDDEHKPQVAPSALDQPP